MTTPMNTPGRRPAGNGRYLLRLRGLWLVTSLELRQRIRSVRWYVALGVWTLVLAGIGALTLAPAIYSSQWTEVQQVAAVVFSLQVILVLFAMLLVVPALSAGSINGDRTAGTLATLQSSLLSPLEIVLGKLAAGWLTGLAFLVLATPSVIPTALLGEIGLLYLARVVLMIALLTLCVTALGLGLSAVTNRQLGSVVLAYVIVFGVTVVGPIVWGVSAVLLIEERDVEVYNMQYSADGVPSSGLTCEMSVKTKQATRLDLTQPLIWPNPVIMLAGVSPSIDPLAPYDEDRNGRLDALRLIKGAVQSTSSPWHPAHFNYCQEGDDGYPEDLGEPPERPLWLLGSAAWMLIGAGSLAIAVYRLSVPIKHLSKGTRIA